MREERVLWAGFALAVIACLMPWVVNETSGLTMGAYDFAEWLSKIPLGDSHLYNTILLLRGQLFLLTCFLAFGAKRPFFTIDWYLRFVFGVLLLVAQLPALNILPGIGTDINRQQQLILATFSLVALILGLSGIISHWRSTVWLLLAIISLITSTYALGNGITIMKSYGLNPTWGFGFISYFLLSLGLLAKNLLKTGLRVAFNEKST
jgi:hypothetical protein